MLALTVFMSGSQVGFLQTQVLGCLGCLWFNRNEVRMRSCHHVLKTTARSHLTQAS
jgi:hypothetical protein